MASKTSLESLKKFSTVVEDASNIQDIRQKRPTEASVSASLILASAPDELYKTLVDQAVYYAKQVGVGKSPEEKRALAMDKLFVLFGKEISQLISGQISTELDGRLSFDVKGSVERALQLIDMYEKEGVPKARILIKLPSTWEGIQVASELEANGVHCSLCNIYNYHQAVACIEAGATLISPCVGPLSTDDKQFSSHNGVLLIRNIYNYLKKFGQKSRVMATSFRTIEEIKGVVGCDRLKISSELREELAKGVEELVPVLTPEAAKKCVLTHIVVDEKTFRYQLNIDAFASEKLGQDFRSLTAYAQALDEILRKEIDFVNPNKGWSKVASTYLPPSQAIARRYISRPALTRHLISQSILDLNDGHQLNYSIVGSRAPVLYPREEYFLHFASITLTSGIWFKSAEDLYLAYSNLLDEYFLRLNPKYVKSHQNLRDEVRKKDEKLQQLFWTSERLHKLPHANYLLFPAKSEEHEDYILKGLKSAVLLIKEVKRRMLQ